MLTPSARLQLLGLRPKIGKQIGPEIGPRMKIGKQIGPGIGFSPDFLCMGYFSRKSYSGTYLFSYCHSGTYSFSYFGPKARNLFSSRLSGSQNWSALPPFIQNLASPFSPYSIQKRLEPQICPRFVPTIVFSEFQSGGPKFVKNLSKI